MATIQELSKICGVSVSTVSKALNGYTDISNKTRDYIIKTAKEVGYLTNGGQGTLKLKKTYNIGVLFSTLTNLNLKNDYFTYILSAFRDEAEKFGYNITFIEHRVGSRSMTYLENCIYRHYDGVLILCADFENHEVIDLIDSDIPVVTIDYAFHNTYSVISDNYEGMKKLVNYVIGQGHTKIAYIHGVDSLVTTNRLEGYYHSLEENGIEIPEEYVVASHYKNPSQAEKLALNLLKMENRPTCILASDDYSAIGVVSAIQKSGLKVVKDVSVAGYNGLDTYHMIGIKLVTVKQDTEKIGKQAADKLIKMIEKPNSQPLDTVFINQTLMIGNSIRKLV